MPFPNANWIPLAAAVLSNVREYYFRVINHLNANGYTHQRSGDGFDTFNVGGAPASSSSATGSGGVNDDAWYVGQNSLGHEVMVQITQGADVDSESLIIQWGVSPAAGFTGGSATVRATATDEGIMPANNYNVSTNNLATGRRKSFGACENSGAGEFFFAFVGDDAALPESQRSRPKGAMVLARWVSTQYSEDDAPYPYFLIQGSTTETFGATTATWGVGAYRDGGPPATTANFDTTLFPELGTVSVNTVPYDGGGLVSWPLEFRTTTPNNTFTVAATFRRKQFTDGGGITRLYEVPPEMNGVDGQNGDAVDLNTMVVPWDASVIWDDADNVLNAREYPAFPYTGGGSLSSIGQPRYRMRAFDTTLAQEVYWTAGFPDSNATQYSGPGPVNSTIATKIIP